MGLGLGMNSELKLRLYSSEYGDAKTRSEDPTGTDIVPKPINKSTEPAPESTLGK